MIHRPADNFTRGKGISKCKDPHDTGTNHDRHNKSNWREMLGNDKEGADHDPRATPEHAQETAEGGGQATDRTDRRSSEAEDDRPSTAKRGPQGTDRTDESTDGDSDEPTQENSDG